MIVISFYSQYFLYSAVHVYSFGIGIDVTNLNSLKNLYKNGITNPNCFKNNLGTRKFSKGKNFKSAHDDTLSITSSHDIIYIIYFCNPPIAPFSFLTTREQIQTFLKQSGYSDILIFRASKLEEGCRQRSADRFFVCSVHFIPFCNCCMNKREGNRKVK